MPLSEDAILAIISRFFPEGHPSLVLGRGDDCAVLRAGRNLAVSTDIFAENAHFRRRYFSSRDVGYKALAVNISDIGAAGAVPEGFSVGLSLTGDEDEAWLCGFCEGMKELTDRFGLAVSGGDLSRTVLQSVCITAWGRLPERLPSGLRRGAAREGDIVFLCGEVGLARVGLMALEETRCQEDVNETLKAWPESCSRHLRPFPLAQAGAALGEFCAAHDLQQRVGLMDVSDGLARDLPRLLSHGGMVLGADIDLPCAMLPEEVRLFAEKNGVDAPAFAFLGGEDYALAGTCPAEAWPVVQEALAGGGHGIEQIGVVHGSSLLLNGMPVWHRGFDHFS